MPQIIVTEYQMGLIAKESQAKIKELEEKWEKLSQKDRKIVIEMIKVFYPEKSKNLNEHWLNTVGDIVGIFDPTGVVDLVNGVSYFIQGDWLFGTLSMVSAIPYVGDIAAKPVMGALKVGGSATRGLKAAESLAKAGKTAEAAAELAKLAEKPGMVGTFLRKASSWAPSLISKVDKLQGGIVKGFKNTIIDWLKLLERSGSKSLKFATKAGELAKMTKVNPAKQVQNIKALQDFLKTEKVWKSSGALKAGAEGLTKKGPLAQIFLGGAPRLFGNRRMRILMRQTKFWLGFLDWVGIGNFVGPEEIAEKLGGEQNVEKMMNQYVQTPQAMEYAQQDFPGEYIPPPTQDFIPTPQPMTPSLANLTSTTQPESNTLKSFINNLFTQKMGQAALLAI